MGILDFFRKKKDTKTISEVKVWLEEISVKRKEKEAIAKKMLEDARDNFLDTIEERIEEAKNADIHKHKIEDRVKVIVKGNLEKYLFYLDLLVKELDKEQDSAQGLLAHITKSINEFEVQSFKAFHKSTYLVGEEIEKINKAFKEFGKLVREIVKEHTVVFDHTYVQIEELIGKIEEKLPSSNELTLEKKELEKEKKKIEKELADLEKSSAYLERKKVLAENEVLVAKKNTLQTEIKKLIDFKELLKTFHGLKTYDTVKEYRDNFDLFFQNPKKLLSLIKEANLETKKIEQLLESIESIRLAFVPDDETLPVKEKLRKVEMEIASVEEKIKRFERTIEKEKDQKKKLIDDLRKTLSSKEIILVSE